jgi:hypothetical protein
MSICILLMELYLILGYPDKACTIIDYLSSNSATDVLMTARSSNGNTTASANEPLNTDDEPDNDSKTAVADPLSSLPSSVGMNGSKSKSNGSGSIHKRDKDTTQMRYKHSSLPYYLAMARVRVALFRRRYDDAQAQLRIARQVRNVFLPRLDPPHDR